MRKGWHQRKHTRRSKRGQLFKAGRGLRWKEISTERQKRADMNVYATIDKHGRIIDDMSITISPYEYSPINKYQAYVFKRAKIPISKFTKTKKSAMAFAKFHMKRGK